MRKKHEDDLEFSMSEPQFLMDVMNRHKDWAVIVCLVGGGQEINKGEAGLLEWFRSIRDFYPDWNVRYAPDLSDYEYTLGENLGNYFSSDKVRLDNDLHLAVSIRSYRAESVSGLIKGLLDDELVLSRDHYLAISNRYPINLNAGYSNCQGLASQSGPRHTENWDISELRGDTITPRRYFREIRNQGR